MQTNRFSRASRWACSPNLLLLVVAALLSQAGARPIAAQEPWEVEYLEQPWVDDLETDADADGVPDGWFNARDVRLEDTGGPAGPRYLAFSNERPGRPARISRAFGIDATRIEALEVAAWVRTSDVLAGDRLGEVPQVVLGFMAENVEPLGEALLGPWPEPSLGEGWTRAVRRVEVPPGTVHVIVTAGLMGATGALSLDGIRIVPLARGGVPTQNLVVNPGAEWGDLTADGWEFATRGARGTAARVSPGRNGSDGAVALSGAGTYVSIPVGMPVAPFSRLRVSLWASGAGLRGRAGLAQLAFLNERGQFVGPRQGPVTFGQFTGSFDWRETSGEIPVPDQARWAALRVFAPEGGGTLTIDDVSVTVAPSPSLGTWTPFHQAVDTSRWSPFEAVATIVPGSALDASFLVPAAGSPADRVVVQHGRLAYERSGERARFFGVSLIPPAAFRPPGEADALATRLAASGINLVRLGGLDYPLGAGLSLFDDARDETRQLDPGALAEIDTLITALESRGIAVVLDLQAGRRFRAGDGVVDHRQLPPGGGPAAAFDPKIRELALTTARDWLTVPRERAIALAASPAVAWVALATELSLFDLEGNPDALTTHYTDALAERVRSRSLGTGRTAWRTLESEQWTSLAKELREAGLQALVAGSAHWRREPEFITAQTAPGLDLIDDRLYWSPSRWIDPERRSLLWESGGGFYDPVASKRRDNRPYVLGEWGVQTAGEWDSPYAAAELLLVAEMARAGDWDAVVRRGLGSTPEVWGSIVPGTGAGDDSRPFPLAVNANPVVFAMLPHAASIVLRGSPNPGGSASNRRPRGLVPGWIQIDTPHTVAVAGWPLGRKPFVAGPIRIELQSDYGAIAVSSVGDSPIAKSQRLLVTAVARAQPTGLSYTDGWRREVGIRGQSPILVEPVRGFVEWTHASAVEAYVLDASGRRTLARPLISAGGRHRLDINSHDGTLHYELVVRDGT